MHPEWKLRVLVVWEPILVTDWRAPSGSTLGRLSDSRARQFWDPKHLVSRALSRTAHSRPSQPRPNSGSGFYWDEAILYAAHSEWKEEPTALFWNGPVYRVIPGLEATVAGSASEKR